MNQEPAALLVGQAQQPRALPQRGIDQLFDFVGRLRTGKDQLARTVRDTDLDLHGGPFPKFSGYFPSQPSQTCQQQASGRPGRVSPPVPARGFAVSETERPGQEPDRKGQITIRFQLVSRTRATTDLTFHIYNIGTISTRLHPLDDEVEDYPDDEYDETGAEDDGYGDSLWAGDRRWRPTAIVGAVVAIGAIATAVVINSGDSASTKATIGPPVSRTPVISTTPRLTAPPSASPTTQSDLSPSPSLRPQLPPETVTTLPPLSTLPSAAPPRRPTAAPPPTAIPPSATLNPRTVVYTVTGTKQLLDLVNIVYTDARGYPRTEFNVALPWTKMVVLNPGVQTESVIATSVYSQLNCAVVNSAGQVVVAKANNASLATCTR
ncbi:MAG: hypothetical protein QOH91_2099 [Mycobacterium sp.]|nr:hypothetical protein [Mycobacterium sp.]